MVESRYSKQFSWDNQYYWNATALQSELRGQIDKDGKCTSTFDDFFEQIVSWHRSVDESQKDVDENLEQLYEREASASESFDEYARRKNSEYQTLKDQGLVPEMMFKIYVPQNQEGCDYERTEPLGNEIFIKS